MKLIKCIVVGDGAAGKTCLLMTNYNNSFPEDYYPHVFNDHSVKINVEGHSIDLFIYDTQRCDRFLRSCLYPTVDVVIICFSHVYKYAFEEVYNYWFQELREYCPNTPFLLVGTKSDLRDDFTKNEDRYKSRGMKPISRAEGEEMKTRIRANKYIECSSKKQINVKEVFYEAAKIALHHKNITERSYERTEENSCCIIY